MAQHALSVVAALLLGAVPALAAPLADVEPWAQIFRKAALGNDVDGILSAVREIADPRFDVAGLRAILDKLGAVVGPQAGDDADEFDRHRLGTFLQRIDVAVHFAKTFLFYSVVFARGPDGWSLLEFNDNTDVNRILDLKWPQ